MQRCMLQANESRDQIQPLGLTWTRKPCCRKETARCRKCSFPLKFANNFHYKYKSQASKAAIYA